MSSEKYGHSKLILSPLSYHNHKDMLVVLIIIGLSIKYVTPKGKVSFY